MADATLARSKRMGLVVLTCVADPDLRARLHDVVRGKGVVRVVASLMHLAAALQESRAVDVIVIPATTPGGDPAGRMTSHLVHEIAANAPHAALIAYCQAGSQHSADIRGLAIAGVHEFLFAGDDSRIALRHVLDTARRECAAERVLAELTRVLPDRIHPLAEACLSRPAEVRSVEGLAGLVGLHRKTVFNQCVQAGIAGPSELIAWCRLALVAYLLQHTRRTVESIADELEFPSVTALRNMMKRYTGLRAKDVRARGGTAAVISAMTRRIRCARDDGAGAMELHVV